MITFLLKDEQTGISYCIAAENLVEALKFLPSDIEKDNVGVEKQRECLLPVTGLLFTLTPEPVED